MPRNLFIAILAVCALLTADSFIWLYLSESALDYVVVLINAVAISLVVCIQRRSPALTKWVRTMAWVWALVAVVFYFSPDFSDPYTAYVTIEGMLELPVFLALYLVLRSQTVRAYLGETAAPEPIALETEK